LKSNCVRSILVDFVDLFGDFSKVRSSFIRRLLLRFRLLSELLLLETLLLLGTLLLLELTRSNGYNCSKHQ